MFKKKAKIVLQSVKNTYNNIADEFSNTRHYSGKEFDLLKTYLKGKVIDLGCGNGRLAKYIKEKKIKCDYLGIDNNKRFIEIAKSLHPKYKFTKGDQLNMPVKSNTANAIANIRAFHHIPSKKLRLEALKEMKRTLKKDGTLIITVWNLWQKKYWKELTKAIIRSIFTLGAYEYNDTFIPWKNKEKRYYHAFTKSELSRIIKKAGLKNIKLSSYGKDIIITAKK